MTDDAFAKLYCDVKFRQIAGNARTFCHIESEAIASGVKFSNCVESPDITITVEQELLFYCVCIVYTYDVVLSNSILYTNDMVFIRHSRCLELPHRMSSLYIYIRKLKNQKQNKLN